MCTEVNKYLVKVSLFLVKLLNSFQRVSSLLNISFYLKVPSKPHPFSDRPTTKKIHFLIRFLVINSLMLFLIVPDALFGSAWIHSDLWTVASLFVCDTRDSGGGGEIRGYPPPHTGLHNLTIFFLNSPCCMKTVPFVFTQLTISSRAQSSYSGN